MQSPLEGNIHLIVNIISKKQLHENQEPVQNVPNQIPNNEKIRKPKISSKAIECLQHYMNEAKLPK